MLTTLLGEWAEPPRSGVQRRATAFGSSAAAHAAFIALCLLIRVPQMREDETARPHYPYRMLQLRTEDLRRSPPAPRKHDSGGQTASNRGSASSPGAPGTEGGQTPRQEAGKERRTFILPPPQPAKPVEHTLVQLDVPEIAPRNELRVPEALIWSRIDARRPLKQFVAPSRKPLQATLKAMPVVPQLEIPNQQTRVADLKMSVDPLAVNPRLTLPNSTTSPVRLDARERGTVLPETTSATPNQESAGNLISVPDISLRSDGMAVTPPANQVAGMRNPDGTAGGSGRGKGSQSGTGEGAGKGKAGAANGEGSGPGGTGKDLQANAGGTGSGLPGGAGGNATGGGAGNGSGSNTGPGTGAASGVGGGTGGVGNSGGAGGPEMVRIVRPANGNHSAVIFGASASEPYPESAGVLSGKVVYTVYLQVGLRKNWILQYCLPKSFSSDGTARGSVSALAAPWPTLIVRPKGNSAPDADYILVHGMITTAGRFVQLATIIPEQFENRRQLLEALQEWEFRPAARDGQPSAVEILLIIPSV